MSSTAARTAAQPWSAATRGSRTVSYGHNRGFVERGVRPGYVSRTYVGGGRPHAYVYREGRYRGFVYYRYIPPIYYGPGFYGWVVTPWHQPVHYTWFGIGRPAPWFGFYAGYWAPYPTYTSPYFWLTDYLIAENLRLAYENQQAANRSRSVVSAPAAQQPALSPAVKALIADEVKQQLEAEKAAAQTSVISTVSAGGAEAAPSALTQRFFVVSSDLDVTVGRQACSLSPGDIIRRTGKDVSSDGTVAAEVVSSKPGNCAVDAAFFLEIDELQEMQNQFREQIDTGLKLLAENQANGLPTAPAAQARTVAEGAATPASDAEALLTAQEVEAAELEAQLR